ncbi:hypothetical protein KIPB_017107, partial [Kipferlia bialata]
RVWPMAPGVKMLREWPIVEALKYYGGEGARHLHAVPESMAYLLRPVPTPLDPTRHSAVLAWIDRHPNGRGMGTHMADM